MLFFSWLRFVCMATYATYAPGFVCNIFWVGDNWSYYTTTVALIYLRDWYSSWTACFTPCDMKTFDQLSYVYICVGNNVISVSPLQSTFKTMNLTDLDFDFLHVTSIYFLRVQVSFFFILFLYYPTCFRFGEWFRIFCELGDIGSAHIWWIYNIYM